MSFVFSPAQVAENIIKETGIDENAVYNDRDGVTRAQLTLLSKASKTIGKVEYTNKDGKKQSSTLKDNIYKTIHRLHGSANSKNIDFAANVKNTMYNTVQFEVMNQLKAEIPEQEREETMIKWLPSTADEQDPFHALNYGKTMTMKAALDKGLGTRFGCQCGMRIIKSSKETETTLKKANSI